MRTSFCLVAPFEIIDHDRNRPQIRPTPAAAPSIIHSDKFNRTLHGVLKLVLGGSNANYYASFSRVLCSATSDRSKATRVRCNPMSNTILLERIVSSNHIPIYRCTSGICSTIIWRITRVLLGWRFTGFPSDQRWKTGLPSRSDAHSATALSLIDTFSATPT